MKPLEIGETATLENGDVVKCVESTKRHLEDNICANCCLSLTECIKPQFDCLKEFRPDYKRVHFELVKQTPCNCGEGYHRVGENKWVCPVCSKYFIE